MRRNLDDIETTTAATVHGRVMIDEKEAVSSTASAEFEAAKGVATEREMIRTWSNGADWPVIGWIALLHIGALAARSVLLGLAS